MNKMNKRRALVTGGAGFLGPYVVKRLLDQDWTVAVLDDFSVGKESHLETFRALPEFTLFKGSITSQALVEDVVGKFQPEVIFHLAAIHFIPYCIAHPGQTIQTNILGTQNLLDSIGAASVQRFVLASTADVYVPSDSPHDEHDPLGSTNIYGITKEFCERLLALARQRFPDRRFLAARLFNIYGPGETNPHVLPDIMGHLRKGNVLRLGNIEPKRDYVFADDVAAALMRMADYEGSHNTFNVATGESRSVRELVSVLERVTGSRISIETDPAKFRKAERQNLLADVSLASTELGWRARIGLEEGLELTLRDDRAGIRAPAA
jgi:UDP-glucose 4-epimerase